jgi:hypothetical protein
MLALCSISVVCVQSLMKWQLFLNPFLGCRRVVHLGWPCSLLGGMRMGPACKSISEYLLIPWILCFMMIDFALLCAFGRPLCGRAHRKQLWCVLSLP